MPRLFSTIFHNLRQQPCYQPGPVTEGHTLCTRLIACVKHAQTLGIGRERERERPLELVGISEQERRENSRDLCEQPGDNRKFGRRKRMMMKRTWNAFALPTLITRWVSRLDHLLEKGKFTVQRGTRYLSSAKCAQAATGEGFPKVHRSIAVMGSENRCNETRR